MAGLFAVLLRPAWLVCLFLLTLTELFLPSTACLRWQLQHCRRRGRGERHLLQNRLILFWRRRPEPGRPLPPATESPRSTFHPLWPLPPFVIQRRIAGRLRQAGVLNVRRFPFGNNAWRITDFNIPHTLGVSRKTCFSCQLS